MYSHYSWEEQNMIKRYCVGRSINSKELSCKKEGFTSGCTEFYAIILNYFTALA